ncbi:MAG: oxaloacetate decarboxylase [Haloferacaceae archaeon]
MSESRSNGAKLRELIESDEILRAPGAPNPLAARALDMVGFDAIYMTGYGSSLTMGVPDAGLITMPEMVRNANNVQERVSVPVVADADNGYGNATNVIRTVREYVKTGVGGIHIEDQTFPKRCGHVSGRQVVPKSEAVGKVRAAADVRDERDEEFVLIARTDARGAVDGSLEDAIDRANAFCEAGADVAFVEGPTDVEELEAVAENVDAPLVYNYAGISPAVDASDLEELGFDLVIYPELGMKAAMMSVYRWGEAFEQRDADALDDLDAAFEREVPFDMHEFAGFPQVVEWEEQYLPEEEAEKYDDTLGANIDEMDNQ